MSEDLRSDPGTRGKPGAVVCICDPTLGSLIPALRQVDLREFQDSLVYTERPCLED